MRRQLFAVLVALALAVPLALIQTPVVAGPGDRYDGPYFGDGNLPPGCVESRSPADPDNVCHHMRTELNPLDSPKIDVAILVPVSPFAERDARVLRQSVDMWEGGIEFLAQEMGLDWLAQGVEFNVTVDVLDPTGSASADPTRIVDPEVVVVATNPVGGLGIGIDPVAAVFTDEDLVPCFSATNALAFDYWQGLEGFDSHHGTSSGTYTEDCGGSGGNICFAVNGAIDPAPEKWDYFRLFDLVSHEFGHCLSLGHVGDSLETPVYGPVPTTDIMAYDRDPGGLTKCVSTLDVEVFAVRMSGYLDVDKDGAVTDDDYLGYNDQTGDGTNPFHVQHPGDHLYASDTGSPMRCPQPDLGAIAGEPTDWTPVPASPNLTITSPNDGASAPTGTAEVTGTLAHFDGPLPGSSGSYEDAPGDGTTPQTDILAVDVDVTDTHLDATVHVADTWPAGAEVIAPVSYSLIVDHRQFDSYLLLDEVTVWNGDDWMAGVSTWDLEAGTVSFHIPRDYLQSERAGSPYFVRALSHLGTYAPFTNFPAIITDDVAPPADEPIVVTGSPLPEPGIDHPGTRTASSSTYNGTFDPWDSSAGVTSIVGLTGDTWEFDVPQKSDVEVTLTWTDDGSEATDLDLFVTGPDGSDVSGPAGATGNPSERLFLNGVEGVLELFVDPFMVGAGGTAYTLTATILTDTDGDGIPDFDDQCPEIAADRNGCPGDPIEAVLVYVDDREVASTAVDTTFGADTFAVPVAIPAGEHIVRVDWQDHGQVIASRSVRVSGPVGGPDADGDGVADAVDNCADKPNADQSNIDGDRKGDACDSDMDGDGHPNAKEAAHGTDPTDPNSYPGGRNLTAAF